MQYFITYFGLGWEHITDIKGVDHLLFVIVLCSVYKPMQWRLVALLVTAFTLGHSVTLALAALKVFVANEYWVELLIPSTILATSIYNLYGEGPSKASNWKRYALALVFGFVHGMGFSNYFNAMMDNTSQVISALAPFNVGLEIGQLCILCAYFALYMLWDKLKPIEHQRCVLFFSGSGTGASLLMILDRL